MESSMVFRQYKSIVWVNDDNETAQQYIDALTHEGYELASVKPEDTVRSICKEMQPSFLVQFQPEDIDSAIQDIIAAKIQAKGYQLTSVLISDEISIESRQKYFQAGGDDLLISPVANNELLSKIKHYQQFHKNQSEFDTQLEEASQMAVLAMENSSDLGGIINFVKSAMNVKTYKDLAEQIFHATSLYCETAIVEIKGHEHHYYFASSGEIDPDMKRFLLAQKENTDRVIKQDEVIQVNHQNLVVLLDGLPVNDPEKMGRISDTVVMLCDTANRFAQALNTEENLSSAEASRSRFLSTLSHELRTPLNGILGFSKALKSRKEDKPLGASGIDALNRIFESTSQINAIITTLIDISSASNGSQDRLVTRNFDICSLALKLETNFKHLANAKGLDFHIDYPDDLSMQGDEKRIYSMLHHLVENAIKFTNEGRIEIGINTDFDPQTGQEIVFQVKDSGIGIDPKDHDRIFSEVGQLNNAHNREHYGVGLGLYYTNLLAQQLNGKISVASALEQGAAFSLSLPAGGVVETSQESALTADQEIDDLLF